MFEIFVRYFFAANLSIGSDGSLLLVSARERMLIWGLVFCVIAGISLLCWYLKYAKRISRGVFLVSLIIPLVIMPSLKLDKIIVREDSFIIHSGFWFYPRVQTVMLNQSDHIHQELNPHAFSKLYGEESVIWTIKNQNTDKEILDLNGFTNDHRMTVAMYLRDRGVVMNYLPYLDCEALC